MLDDKSSREINKFVVGGRPQPAERGGGCDAAGGLRRKSQRSRTSFTVHQLDQLETGDVILSLNVTIRPRVTLTCTPDSEKINKFQNVIIIIISIRTKSTNTEKQLTQRYRL